MSSFIDFDRYGSSQSSDGLKPIDDQIEEQESSTPIQKEKSKEERRKEMLEEVCPTLLTLHPGCMGLTNFLESSNPPTPTSTRLLQSPNQPDQ